MRYVLTLLGDTVAVLALGFMLMAVLWMTPDPQVQPVRVEAPIKAD